MSISVIPKCPNCGSFELVGGEGYWFCTVCGYDQLDDKETD
jgi:ribosomal protein L37AE/L43A